MGKVHPRMGRRGPSRVRPGQVADAMRVRAGVAPRVASGDPAASKGKSAGGASYNVGVGSELDVGYPNPRN